jgi:hypothetical protein
VRSRAAVRVVVAAAFAGTGSTLSTDAGARDDRLEHAEQQRSYNRSAIAQGAPRYGLPPVRPSPGPTVQLRLSGSPEVLGVRDEAPYQRVVFRALPRLQRCAEAAFGGPGRALLDRLRFSVTLRLPIGATTDPRPTATFASSPRADAQGAVDRLRGCVEATFRWLRFAPPSEEPVEIHVRGAVLVISDGTGRPRLDIE